MSPAPAPSCRYYGKSHAVLKYTGRLYDQYGNECALIFDAFAPCKMEVLGHAPDETRCPIALGHERRAREAAEAAYG